MDKPSERNRALARRRQAPIGPYIADFASHALKLVIEADGGIHRLHQERDANRDAWLAQAGYAVLRFDNAAILRNPNIVFDAVRERAEHQRRHP